MDASFSTATKSSNSYRWSILNLKRSIFRPVLCFTVQYYKNKDIQAYSGKADDTDDDKLKEKIFYFVGMSSIPPVKHKDVENMW